MRVRVHDPVVLHPNALGRILLPDLYTVPKIDARSSNLEQRKVEVTRGVEAAERLTRRACGSVTRATGIPVGSRMKSPDADDVDLHEVVEVHQEVKVHDVKW